MAPFLRTFLVVASACSLAFATGCSASQGDGAVGSEDDELATCGGHPAEVFLWSPRDPLEPITQQLKTPSKCTQYYVGIPLDANEKTLFHPAVKNEIARVHANGPNFHAVAEFNFGAWNHWIRQSPGTRDWETAGHVFRSRMEEAGFDIHYGNSDTWLVQELPSTLIDSHDGVDKHDLRAHVVSLVKAIADGGKVHKMGGVVRTGYGQDVQNTFSLGVHKANLEELLTDEGFWHGIEPYVRWWGEEVYADAHDVCTTSSTIAEKASHVNDYVFSLPRLAAVGPAQASAARSFLEARYVPWINGAWNGNVGYGDNRISSAHMEELLSLQVYSVRAWAGAHPAPGPDHLAVAWVPLVSNDTERAEADKQAARLAAALDDVYAREQKSSYACSPSGAFTFCDCRLDGAKFTEAWRDEFGKW